jgi:HNH endonuclease
MKKQKYTKEDFIKAVQESSNISQTLKKLGLSQKGGNYQTFHSRVREYNLDISHFDAVPQAHNKGKIFGPKRPLEDYLSNKFSINSYRLKRRLIEEGLKEPKCETCNRTAWNRNPIPLELHHINGVSIDNSFDNIQLLCPNCHAQTSNYRGKNKLSLRI